MLLTAKHNISYNANDKSMLDVRHAFIKKDG